MPISSRWRSISVVLPLLFTAGAALATVPALARAPETAAVLETIEFRNRFPPGRRSLADARQRRRCGSGGGRWTAVRPWHRRQMGPAERDPLVRRRRNRGQRYRQAGSLAAVAGHAAGQSAAGGSRARPVLYRRRTGGHQPWPGPSPHHPAKLDGEPGSRRLSRSAPLPPQHRCPYRRRPPPHLRR